MKRLALSLAIVALSLGGCERQSAETLPEHYQRKWDAKPSGDEKAKAPDAAHHG